MGFPHVSQMPLCSQCDTGVLFHRLFRPQEAHFRSYFPSVFPRLSFTYISLPHFLLLDSQRPICLPSPTPYACADFVRSLPGEQYLFLGTTITESLPPSYHSFQNTATAALSLRRSRAAWATMYANSSYRETPPCLLTRSCLSSKNYIHVYNVYIMQCDHTHPHIHTITSCLFPTPADYPPICSPVFVQVSWREPFCCKLMMYNGHVTPEGCFIAPFPILQILTNFFHDKFCTIPLALEGMIQKFHSGLSNQQFLIPSTLSS